MSLSIVLDTLAMSNPLYIQLTGFRKLIIGLGDRVRPRAIEAAPSAFEGTAPSSHSPLLDLPPEVLSLIFSYLSPGRWHHTPSTLVPTLLACSELHDQALPHLYNRCEARYGPSLRLLLRTLAQSPETARHVRTLRLMGQRANAPEPRTSWSWRRTGRAEDEGQVMLLILQQALVNTTNLTSFVYKISNLPFSASIPPLLPPLTRLSLHLEDVSRAGPDLFLLGQHSTLRHLALSVMTLSPLSEAESDGLACIALDSPRLEYLELVSGTERLDRVLWKRKWEQLRKVLFALPDEATASVRRWVEDEFEGDGDIKEVPSPVGVVFHN